MARNAEALRGVYEGGVRYVYDRWAHMHYNASKIEGIRTPNKEMVIPFSWFFYVSKGKTVNS